HDGRAGARHLLSVPAVRDLADEPRLLELAAGLIGGSAVPFRATLFDKSPRVNWLVAWHQDTALPLRRRFDSPEWGPWSVKAGILYARAPASALARVVALRVHLDPSTTTNGPLRVLPGTHTRGVLGDEAIAALARTVHPVECLSPRGGVLAMRPLLVHASSKSVSTRPRRVLHLEYASSLLLENDAELAVV